MRKLFKSILVPVLVLVVIGMPSAVPIEAQSPIEEGLPGSNQWVKLELRGEADITALMPVLRALRSEGHLSDFEVLPDVRMILLKEPDKEALDKLSPWLDEGEPVPNLEESPSPSLDLPGLDTEHLLLLPPLIGEEGPDARQSAAEIRGEVRCTDITVEEVKAKLDSGRDILILDVRPPEEYESGHIPGAESAPLYMIDNATYLHQYLDRFWGGDIIVYGDDGTGSSQVCRILADYGIQNVYNLLGGIEAWINAGFPVQSAECLTCPGSKMGNSQPSGLPSPDRAEGGLETVRTAIEEENAGWRAGMTSVSGLSPEDKERLCGLQFTEKDPSQVGIANQPLTKAFPPMLDWRNEGGVDWTTPVKDQANCGSCWAFGSLAALESQIDIATGNPAFDIDLSEQYLLSCSGGSCDGWYEDRVLDFLRDSGTSDEECLPYMADDTIPCRNAYPYCEERKWNIENWKWVSVGTPTAEEIKVQLQYHPIVAAFDVYEDFFYYTGGVYEHVWGGLMGGHMVAIVGWDDVSDSWICKNSWGTDWGETVDFQPCTPGEGNGGWFRIKRGQCDIEYWTAYSTFELAERVISCDAEGKEKDFFSPGDDVYVKAIGLSPVTDYLIWIQPDPVGDSDALDTLSDPSGAQELITTDINGNLSGTLIWSIPEGTMAANQEYDIVLDRVEQGSTGSGGKKGDRSEQTAGKSGGNANNREITRDEGSYDAVNDAIDAAGTVGLKFAPSLDSYSDEQHTVPCDDFEDYDTGNTVYMYGGGYKVDHEYKVSYYDGSNALRETETVVSSPGGYLSSRYEFSADTDFTGEWHAIVCQGYQTPPPYFSPVWEDIIAIDSFAVHSSSFSPADTLIYVHENSYLVYGYTTPGVDVEVTLKDAGLNTKDTASDISDDEGYFSVKFSELILGGDTVEVAPYGNEIVTIFVEPLTAEADRFADAITGTGLSNSALVIAVCREECSQQELLVDGGGNYIADFSGIADIRRGDDIYVRYSNPDGNQVYIQFTIPVVYVSENSNWVEGYTVPDVNVKVTLKNSGLIVKDVEIGVSDNDGHFLARFDKQIVGGDTIEVAPEGEETIAVYVEPLTARADKVAETVSGAGPPNSTLVIEVCPQYELSRCCTQCTDTDSEGDYIADFSGIADIQGEDYVYVRYTDPEGNQVYIRSYVPIVYVLENSRQVHGYTTPNVNLEVTLKDAGLNIKEIDSLISSSSGSFYANFHQPVVGGDTVEIIPEGEPVITIYVEPITIKVDRDTDTISGTGPPSSNLRVEVLVREEGGLAPKPLPIPPLSPWMSNLYTQYIDTNSEGNYVADFSGIADIRGGDYVYIYYTNLEGNKVCNQSGVPIVYVRDNYYKVYGYTVPNVDVGVTLRDDSLAVKDIGTNTSGDYGYFSVWFDELILSGDTVEVAPEGEETITVFVEPMTAEVDREADTISGSGPPDSNLMVRVCLEHEPDGCYTQNAETDNEGSYLASFSRIADIQGGDFVYLYYTNPEGNQVYTQFGVPFVYIQENYYCVGGYTTPYVDVEIILKDAGLNVKNTVSVTSGCNGYFYTYFNQYILGGDTVEVVPEGEEAITVFVEPLTAETDKDADNVSGTGPPNSTIEVEIYLSHEPWMCYTLYVGTDGDGIYIANFSGTADIQGGDYGNVYFTNSDGNQVYIPFAVPIVYVRENSPLVVGCTTPLANVEVTLKDTVLNIKDTDRDWSSGYGDFSVKFNQPILGGDTVEVATEGRDTITVYVEPLTVETDKDADTVSGTGPPDSTLMVELWVDEENITAQVSEPVTASMPASALIPTPIPPVPNSWKHHTLNVSTDGEGSYVADFSGTADVRGEDYGYVHYTNPEGNQVYVRFTAPIVYVWENTYRVYGWAEPNVDREVTLRDALFEVKDTVTSTSRDDGYFSIYFDQLILGGDTVEVAPEGGEVITIFVEPLTAEVDKDVDTISGTGPTNSILQVEVEGNSQYVDTDSEGNYLADFSSIVDIQGKDRCYVRYTNAEGNQVYIMFTVPIVYVRENYNQVYGYTKPYVDVEVTLRDAMLDVKDTATSTSRDGDYFSVWFDECISGGDTVEISPEGGDIITVYVEPITAEVDKGTDTVSGTGPPGSTLKVEIGGYSEYVDTDSEGNYIVDFGGIADIRGGEQCRVYYTNPEGNQVYIEFIVFAVNVWENRYLVYGYTTPNVDVEATLKDAGLAVKDTATDTSSNNGYFSVWLDERISGGDTIEVAAEGEAIVTVFVEPLTAKADRHADTVSGTGPPTSTLGVEVYISHKALRKYSQYTDTNGEGNYLADFGGIADIQGEDYGYIRYTNPEGNQVYIWYAVPVVHVFEGTALVEGMLSVDGGTVQFALKGSDKIIKATATEYVTDGVFQAVLRDVSGRTAFIAGGDTIEVTPDGGDMTGVFVEPMTVGVDYEANIISGVGPASSALLVEVYHDSKCYSRSAVIDMDGYYSADFNGVIDITGNDYGYIRYTDEDDNVIILTWAEPDAYEPDDNPGDASEIEPGTAVQTHSFHRPTDEDWVSFQAVGGNTYRLVTGNLGPRCNTYLYLYDTDGTTLLASNDNYDYDDSSRINWVCPTSGTYYARIRQFSPLDFGPDLSYDFSISQVHLVIMEVESTSAATGSSASVDIWVRGYPGVPDETPYGIGAYDIRVDFDPAMVNITGVLPGNAPFDSTYSYNIKSDCVLIAGYHAEIPGPGGDIRLCGLEFTCLAEGETTLVLTVRTLCDVSGEDIETAIANGTILQTSYIAETAIFEERDMDGVVVIPVTIVGIKDPVTADTINGISIGSYTATASYAPAGIEILDVLPGDPPFDTPVFNIYPDYTTVTQSDLYGAEPLVTVARIVVRLVGSAADSHNLGVTFSTISDIEETDIPQQAPQSLTFHRGDIQKPEDGDVDIIDAMFGAQYVVGAKAAGDINQQNMASVKHDGTGDIPNITDCMFIAQYVVGIRDEYFQRVP